MNLCVGDVVAIFFIDDFLMVRRVSGICCGLQGRGISKSISVFVAGEIFMRFFVNSPLVIDIKKLRTLDKSELNS